MNLSKQELIKALVDIDDEHFKLARDSVQDFGFNLEELDLEDRLIEQAEKGRVEAQHALSKLALLGWFGERNYSMSYEWCKRAAASDFPPALDLLANLYLEGKGGIKSDIDAALRLKEKAASLGYSSSLRSLAIMYATGTHVKQDAELAQSYLQHAAVADDAKAQFLLGSQLLELGSSTSTEEGIQWIESAASKDLPSALRRLADFYQNGSHGYTVDRRLSKQLLEKADRTQR